MRVLDVALGRSIAGDVQERVGQLALAATLVRLGSPRDRLPCEAGRGGLKLRRQRVEVVRVDVMRRPNSVPVMLGALSFVLATGCSEGGDASASGASEGSDPGSGSSSDDGSQSGSPGSSTNPSDDASDDGTGATDPGDDDTGEVPSACGEVRTFEDGRSPSAEIHVATEGRDGDGCGAVDAPCGSLEAAAAQASPGTAIRVHAGTYRGGTSLSGLAGTAEAPIWIGGAPGEARPVFEGDAQAMHLSRARYVVLHDLEVRDTTANGINIDDGGATGDPEATHDLVIRGLHIHDIGTGGNNDCLKLSGVNAFAVLDSEFSACGGGSSGSGIDMVGCHRGVIAFSRFHDLPESGNAVQTKGGSEDIEIYANRFENAGQRAINMGGSTGFEFFRPPLDPTATQAEARDIRAVANVFVGGFSQVALVGCTGCLVANNTMAFAEHWVLRILQETTSTDEYTFAPSGNNRVVNNLVVFSRAAVGTVINVGPDTAPETFVFEHDLWFAADAPGESDPGLPVPEAGGIVGVDPLLEGDLSITAESPAAGAGIAVEGLRGDHRGACWTTPPSLGAFEP